MSEIAIDTKTGSKPKAPPIALAGVAATARQVEGEAQILRSANEKLVATVDGVYRTGAKESAEYAMQFIQISQNNLKSACELAGALMAAKTPSEIIEVTSAHARKQLELIAEQNRRMWTLAQKVSAAMTQPAKEPGAERK